MPLEGSEYTNLNSRMILLPGGRIGSYLGEAGSGHASGADALAALIGAEAALYGVYFRAPEIMSQFPTEGNQGGEFDAVYGTASPFAPTRRGVGFRSESPASASRWFAALPRMVTQFAFGEGYFKPSAGNFQLIANMPTIFDGVDLVDSPDNILNEWTNSAAQVASLEIPGVYPAGSAAARAYFSVHASDDPTVGIDPPAGFDHDIVYRGRSLLTPPEINAVTFNTFGGWWAAMLLNFDARLPQIHRGSRLVGGWTVVPHGQDGWGAANSVGSEKFDLLEDGPGEAFLTENVVTMSAYAFTPEGDLIPLRRHVRQFGLPFLEGPDGASSQAGGAQWDIHGNPVGLGPKNPLLPDDGSYSIPIEDALLIPAESGLIITIDTVLEEPTYLAEPNYAPVSPITLEPIARTPDSERVSRSIWAGVFDDSISSTIDSAGEAVAAAQVFTRYDSDIRTGDVLVSAGRRFWRITRLTILDRNSYLSLDVTDVSASYE